ncbi:hypothetical protein SAMN05444410_101259 [Hydrobacter penzbergensis]|uniref:Uncharacterized protein n=2 Tax=Hydrobacter penzbergensis TaxID=1235997 RepID=A0A8X8I8K7_9BACT|nr:hypothetical protein SAMN05444410_101259 [Hydrobacter penzbergensis]
MPMHLQFWKQFCWLAAGLPAAAWCMYVAMRFLIFACADDVLERYHRWGVVGQLYFIVVELGFFEVFNRLRLYIVKQAYKALVPPMRWRLPAILLYASAIWLLCMYYLLMQLWDALPVYHLDVIIQFFLLCTGLSVMMGIALPYSALRGWRFVWHLRNPASKSSKPG